MDKLFEPSRKFIKTTNLYKFQTYLEQKLSKKFLSYNKLWLWTNKNPGEFWESIVEYFNIDLERKRSFIAYIKKSFWNSEFIISNDTGPAHMAAHLNVKGLVLFGSHTTAKKVSIEREYFKAIQVSDLTKLSADKVFQRMQEVIN